MCDMEASINWGQRYVRNRKISITCLDSLDKSERWWRCVCLRRQELSHEVFAYPLEVREPNRDLMGYEGVRELFVVIVFVVHSSPGVNVHCCGNVSEKLEGTRVVITHILSPPLKPAS